MPFTTAQKNNILTRLIGSTLSNGEYLIAVERLKQAKFDQLLNETEYAEMIAYVRQLLLA